MKMIKKITATTAILMGLMNIGFAQDSNALIGLAFKSTPVKVIGAVGAIGGGGLAVYGYATAATIGTLSGAFGGLILTGYGAIIAGIGLVILDEKQIADIEFKAIDVSRPDLYFGFTKDQVDTYNSELERLNSIRQTIISESNKEPDTKDAEELWKKYSVYISRDTFAIAQKNAEGFLKAIR